MRLRTTCTRHKLVNTPLHHTFGHVRPKTIHISIRAVCLEYSLERFWITMNAKLLHADSKDSANAQAALSLRRRTYQKVRFLMLQIN